jgi:hypothetical protein
MMKRPNVGSILETLTLDEKVALHWLNTHTSVDSSGISVSRQGLLGNGINSSKRSAFHQGTLLLLIFSGRLEDLTLQKTSDGPNGARGEVFNGGTRAACFPAAVCSASTWNPDLSRRIGNAIAEETLTKGARVLYVSLHVTTRDFISDCLSTA